MEKFLEKKPKLIPQCDICIIFDAVIEKIKTKFEFFRQFQWDPTCLPNYTGTVPDNEIMFIAYIEHCVNNTRLLAKGKQELPQIILSNGKYLPNKQYVTKDSFIHDWELLVVNSEKYYQDENVISWAEQIVDEVHGHFNVCSSMIEHHQIVFY